MAPTVDYLLARREAVEKANEKRLEAMDRQIAEELTKPTEESLGFDADQVLWFQMRFGGVVRHAAACEAYGYYGTSLCTCVGRVRSKLYIYAAIRIPQLGKWVVTGPADDTYMTFRELWDKYLSKADDKYGIQKPTGYERVKV